MEMFERVEKFVSHTKKKLLREKILDNVGKQKYI